MQSRRRSGQEERGALGCWSGGEHHREGAWVSGGGGAVCRCVGGRLGSCREGEARGRGGATSLQSFPVSLTFGTSSKGKGGGWTRPASSAKRPGGLLSLGTFYKTGSPAGSAPPRREGSPGVGRRLTSGKGTAKLFRLFPEVHEPAARTSNRTGCTVKGEFYSYPSSLSPSSACRCTDSGMLWCWAGGVPRCSGCLVSRTYIPVGAAFTLVGGRACDCDCHVKMDRTCLEGPLLRVQGRV